MTAFMTRFIISSDTFIHSFTCSSPLLSFTKTNHLTLNKLKKSCLELKVTVWQTERRQLNVRRDKNIVFKKWEKEREISSCYQAVCRLDRGPKNAGWKREHLFFLMSFKVDAKCRKSYQMLPKKIHTVQGSNNLRKTRNTVQINTWRGTCTQCFPLPQMFLDRLAFHNDALLFLFFMTIWMNHKNMSRFYLTAKLILKMTVYFHEN